MSVKWSAFAAGSAIGGTDIPVGLQSGANVQWTMTQLKTWTSASPTLVTPVLGVATGTSIALGGATLGSNALAVTGSGTFSGALLVSANDGAALGVSGAAWADLFLASGGVINWAAGNATLTHATGALQLSSATTFGWSTDLLLSRSAAATLQLGAADAAAPVAQTLKAQSGLAGSGSNIGGPDLTIQPGLGTGFGTTSTYGLGRVVFSTPVQKATGTTIQTYATAAAIGPQTITSTTSNPVLDLNQTWNNAGLTATGLKLNVTNTSSAAASLLMDLQIGGSSVFRVQNNGQIFGQYFTFTAGAGGATTGYIQTTTGGNYIFNNQDGASAGSIGIGADLLLTRTAAASLQLGAADAATAVAQTFQVQSIVTGTADVAGQNWTHKGSASTGSAASGNLIFQVAGKGAASTTVNTYNTGLTIVSGTTNNTNVGYPSVVIGTAALATTATDGFLYIPSSAGQPAGTPTSFTGRVALCYDTTNHQFWIYDGGWKQPKTPAAAAIVTWQ